MKWKALNSEFSLQEHKEKLRYRRAVRDDHLKNCAPDQFEIHGYTMMSDHGHLSGAVNEAPMLYSNHMRRAHSRFGLASNRHHNRSGKVANDRPKIKASQDEAYAIEVMLYDLFNPVPLSTLTTASSTASMSRPKLTASPAESRTEIQDLRETHVASSLSISATKPSQDGGFLNRNTSRLSKGVHEG